MCVQTSLQQNFLSRAGLWRTYDVKSLNDLLDGYIRHDTYIIMWSSIDVPTYPTIYIRLDYLVSGVFFNFAIDRIVISARSIILLFILLY